MPVLAASVTGAALYSDVVSIVAVMVIVAMTEWWICSGRRRRALMMALVPWSRMAK